MIQACLKTFDVDISIMWYIAYDSRCYNLDVNMLKIWFQIWFTRKSAGEWEQQDVDQIELARQQLYPCWVFDYADGFAAATRKLVYGSSAHISQKNPARKRDHEVPARIMSKLAFLQDVQNVALGFITNSIGSRCFERCKGLGEERSQ